MSTVASIMSTDPITLGPKAAVGTALGLMDKHRIRHLPIVDDGRLVGIVSERDLRSCQPPLEEEWGRVGYAIELLEQPVADHMIREVHCVPPSAPIATAVDIVVDNRIGCLCVTEDGTGRLRGIVSQLDLLAELRPTKPGV
jgi:acetoin utilization protein AcuB